MATSRALQRAAVREVRILMLEDNALDADLAMARLESAGFDVKLYRAECKDEFIDHLHARSYDLILSDYALPDFDGAAALEMAKAVCPRVPFIMVSGQMGEEIAIDTLHRGATDYVLKQRIERLAPAVTRALMEVEEHSIRLRAEARARESEDRFQQLTNALPQMVWTTDTAGNLTYANAAWKRAIPENVNHWRDPAIVHPEDVGRCNAAASIARQSRKPFSLECRFLYKTDGIYHWHLVRAVPFDSSEGVPSWLGTATDLHEQKLREEAFHNAEKLAVTGRMAASIAHEINNPLESLMNLIFLLKADERMPEGSQAYLTMAEHELERVSSIVKQTLQYYREPETVTKIDAGELFRSVVSIFAGRLRGKRLQLLTEVEAPVSFTAIAGEIRQVLINLVANAIDAVNEDGRIVLGARALVYDDLEMVALTVTDNGVGITPKQAEQLFQPFFSTKGVHGTGLGLWVSKGIVEKRGGRIQLESQEKDGATSTTATVLLPVESASYFQPSKKENGSSENPV